MSLAREEIIKKLDDKNRIIAYMHGKQYITTGRDKKIADKLIEIKKNELNIDVQTGSIFYRWGWPGPDYNVYLFDDYGKTWAFTRKEFEPNPYPKE